MFGENAYLPFIVKIGNLEFIFGIGKTKDTTKYSICRLVLKISRKNLDCI